MWGSDPSGLTGGKAARHLLPKSKLDLDTAPNGSKSVSLGWSP
jgi:hypothetical protein